MRKAKSACRGYLKQKAMTIIPTIPGTAALIPPTIANRMPATRATETALVSKPVNSLRAMVALRFWANLSCKVRGGVSGTKCFFFELLDFFLSLGILDLRLGIGEWLIDSGCLKLTLIFYTYPRRVGLYEQSPPTRAKLNTG